MRGNARSIGLVLCLATVCLSAARVPAQSPNPSRIVLKTAQFKLPVLIDDDARVKIQELRLYVKGPEGSWVCTETAPPTATHFTFKANQDGEYHFTFVTIDRAGRMNPSSFENVPPHRSVLVDTTPPELGIKVVTALNRETYLQVQMTDANPDPKSVQMSYPIARGGWQLMEPAQSDRPGTYKLPPTVEQVGVVRVQAADLAGNIAVREFHIKGLVAQEKQEKQAEAVATAPAPAPASFPAVLTKVEKRDEAMTPTSALPVIQPLAPLSNDPPKVETEKPKLPDLDSLPSTKPTPLEEAPVTPPTAWTKNPEPAVKELSAPETVTPKPPVKEAVASSGAEATPASPATTNFINTTKCSLNYVFDNADPNNPVRPEFWATRDGGRNWQRLNDESGGKSPARLDLPGEGLYGIAIRTATNGQGPTPADRPDCWVEVDTSKPFVNLLEPTLGKDADTGTLLIFWTAHDKNLREDAITIAYATRPEGPWLTILQNHKNEGIYRWIMPTGLGPQLYLRIEATDLAGNVGRTELRKAVQLELSQPKARVISVAPAK